MKRRQAPLQDVLHRCDNAPALGALQRETVAFQLASGLPALHDSNVLHRDVQSSNALLIINAPQCGGVQACLSDFAYMSGDTGAAGYPWRKSSSRRATARTSRAQRPTCTPSTSSSRD